MSFRLASAIAREETSRVLHAATTVDPNDDAAWATQVQRPAFELGHICKTATDGWGRGLFGGSAFFWGGSLGWFANLHVLNTPYMYLEAHDISSGRDPGSTRNIFMLALILLAMIPILLAGDIAATSSRCDMLSDSLNAVAVSNDPASHLKVDFLETRLRRMNRGQGL